MTSTANFLITATLLTTLISAVPVENIGPLDCLRVNTKNGKPVRFVADVYNLCMYWECIRKDRMILRSCAPGTKMSKTYINDVSNPCVVRTDDSEDTCMRPGPGTTKPTESKPTKMQDGGSSVPTIKPIPIPTESLIGRRTRGRISP